MNHPLKLQHYLLISISTLLAGVLFYGLYNGFIVLQFPHQKQALDLKNLGVEKKKFKLFYNKSNKWHYEEREILSSGNKQQTLFYVISQWLSILYDEQIISKKISLNSILLDQNGNEAFISFDRKFFGENTSIYDKMLLIEALLKTIRDNGIIVQNVRILVQNKPLADPHLDFSQPWPLGGYLPL